MAGNANGVARVMSLYRQVLRLHRTKLAGPVRSLGDSFAREEFQQHLRGKTTPAQWQRFGESWSEYVDALSGEQSGKGASEEEQVVDVIGQLSPQQRQQIEQLRAELGQRQQPPTSEAAAWTHLPECAQAAKGQRAEPDVLRQELDKLLSKPGGKQ